MPRNNTVSRRESCRSSRPSTRSSGRSDKTCWMQCRLLFKNFGLEFDDFIILRHVSDLDRPATHLTILDIYLRMNGQIQHHRDPLPTVRTGEEVFHVI